MEDIRWDNFVEINEKKQEKCQLRKQMATGSGSWQQAVAVGNRQWQLAIGSGSWQVRARMPE